jgi:hypothetical protein
MKTLELFDRGAAAYAVAVGVPLLRVVPGDWQRFAFDDSKGLASEALTAWRDGTATVNARAYWNAFKTLKKATYTTTISSRNTAQENGHADAVGAA